MTMGSAVKAVKQSWILFLVVISSVLMFPFLLLANMNSFVGQFYYWAMFAFVERYWLRNSDHKIRVELFSLLAEDCERCKKSGSSFRVLEIGPGTGGNFAYYPPGVLLTTLEQNPYLKKHAASIKRTFPDLKIENNLIGNAENMAAIPDKSFDAVVGTHVLCCIRKNEDFLREVSRILKDGGKFYTSERLPCDKKDRFKRLVQQLIAPFWYLFTMGCTAGYFDPSVLLPRGGFDVSRMQEYEFPDGPLTHTRYFFGAATKQQLK